MWPQIYDPLNSATLSTLCAALPVVVLLGTLGIFHVKAHNAALLGLATSLAIAIFIFGMPAGMAAGAAAYGAAYGLFPIGWIVLNVIFLYQLTNDRGLFAILRTSITTVTADRRLQLLLVAFCFGAFFEGAAGFGTPVAVTAAILIGLGFTPLAASGLSLIANTAPVAFGALGTPIIALASVTGLELQDLSAMVGRQLPFFSVIVPFWLIWAFAGFRGTIAIWPAILVAGIAFAVPQFLVSNYHGPWLVDVVSAVVSMGALALLLRVWHPHDAGYVSAEIGNGPAPLTTTPDTPSAQVIQAWTPWIILSVVVFMWGLPQVKAVLDGISIVRIPVAGLHNLVLRVPPVVEAPTPEAAIFALNWLSATGSGIFIAAVIAGFTMGYSVRELLVAVLAHAAARSLFTADDCRDAIARVHDTLLRSRRDHGPGVCADRRAVSAVRNDARVAGCCTDRIRYLVERAVREPAANHGRAAWTEPDADGGGEQFGRRDGQNDRRTVDRRRKYGHALVRTRGHDSAIRVLPQRRARGAGGPAGHAAGVRAAVYIDGGPVV